MVELIGQAWPYGLEVKDPHSWGNAQQGQSWFVWQAVGEQLVPRLISGVIDGQIYASAVTIHELDAQGRKQLIDDVAEWNTRHPNQAEQIDLLQAAIKRYPSPRGAGA